MQKTTDSTETNEKELFVNVSDDLEIFTKILSKDNEVNRTCLYIHGGAFAGNHTMIERPARWLLKNNYFSKMILIDRRGDGLSSNLKRNIL